ncbi:hypothetical protein GCM10007216_27630 [Thalassobacillus devorans]|uniref:Uncharacterized protein n=1 Tax=Thalassobacillus devorans TaxID=279813 RepID=A0ABQ1PDZ1_9BACI|nr:hypothetical protein [Thalassobacillus devorans]NIK29265.1 hypothetical protein [Thalassobacillus devorans]GGC95340.1 hypothetical protein GCM10007216_27630 [Thalassobacillus devorans]
MKKYLNLNTLYIVMGIIAVGSFLIPQAIDMYHLQAQGINHIADDAERYMNNAHNMEGDYTITIDLSDPESNEGKFLFDDEEGNQIYVSKIIENESNYEVIFRSSGTYSRGGATLVSGIEHYRNINGYTHELKAEAHATYNYDTFKLTPSSSSALHSRSGDEFGFYLFPTDKDVDLDKEPTIEVTITNLQLNLWAKF